MADSSRFKHDRIRRALRQQIVQGILAPGGRLPTRDELQARFAASRHTVQRALEGLKRDGFITTNGKLGTFVADNPPHLAHYGFVFPFRPPWSRFYTTLHAAALEMAASQSCRVTAYYSRMRGPADEDVARLQADVRAHRLAGLVFAYPPGELAGTPAVDQPDMPRVGIIAAPILRDMPVVFPDVDSFLTRALEHLASRGRRRAALLWLDDPARHAGVLAGCGLEVRPQWNLRFHAALPAAARQPVQLLLDRPPADRPDGLIVTDDNLVADAVAGVIAAGVRVPQDLEIVSHANFPQPVPTSVPTTRLGFDCRTIMRLCFETIAARRRGREVPRETRVPALFEEELGEPDAPALAAGSSALHLGPGVPI